MYVHPASQQKASKTAVGKAGITKNASVHTYSKTQLRDTFIGKWLGYSNDPGTHGPSKLEDHYDL